MKKLISILLVCVVCVTSSMLVNATTYDTDFQDGFVVEFNGEATDYTSVIHNGVHYVPMRKVFEEMGALLFYRSRDRKILTLTRDGDMIFHSVRDNNIIVNGEEKTFENPSVLIGDVAYIPIDMVSAAFVPDEVSYDNQKLIIKKYMFSNEYHKLVKDVSDLCWLSNFYPERFQRYISYHTKMPAYTIEEVIARVNLGLDYPFYENVVTIEQPYELLVLVNKYNQLPSGFMQYNLVNMDRGYTIDDGKAYLLAGVAYEKYVQMIDAAKQEGLSMKVVSAYRTEDYQRSLYNNKVWSAGKEYADNYSARPGFSEHQTGLAVDINSTKTAFEYSDEFKWLQNHAHEYGYIMRYPKGKEWITGYAYEPWHYRFVGTDSAKIIYEEGITYEEFYAKYVSVNEFK